jgi:ABC-2 type transport system ATP-binding protein
MEQRNLQAAYAPLGSTPAADFLLDARGVTKKYGQQTVLKNVNLRLPRGRIVGLLGPNGSGKTTFIKIINGLIRDFSGELLVDGQPPNAYTKNIISYLPDKNFFANWMKAKDAIALFRDFYQDFDAAKAENMLIRLGIDRNQKIKTMSKGMVDKFQLSLVMSRQAQLYVLDEPICGVDPAARDFILDTVLQNFNEQGTILMSTHLIADVERIFDTVIFLKEGEVVLFDEIDAIRERTGHSIDELFREEFKC